jgi:hypothetical protein
MLIRRSRRKCGGVRRTPITITVLSIDTSAPGVAFTVASCHPGVRRLRDEPSTDFRSA